MGTASRIRWNSLFSFLSQVIRLGTNMIMFIGIARFYGAEAFGQFTTAHTFTSLFFIVADFGFDLLLSTEVARNQTRAKEILERYLPLKLVFTFTAVVLMSTLAFFGSQSESTKMLMYIFSLGIIGNSLANFFFALMKGYEQLQHETKISFFQNLLLLVVLLTLGLLHTPIVYVAIAFVVSRFAGLVLIYFSSIRVLKFPSISFSLEHWKETLVQCLPFGFNLLFGTLYFQLDTILLSYWKGDYEVGIYQAAMKLLVLVLIIPEVIINAMLPVLSRFHSEDEGKWLHLGKLLHKTLFYTVMPIAMIFFLYTERIIEIVYGVEKFKESIPILRLFSVCLLIRFFNATVTVMLTTSRRQSVLMMISIGLTILNIGFNVFAIPLYGTIGAAYVSLITTVIAGIPTYIIAKKYFWKILFDTRLMVTFVLIGVTTFALWSIKEFSMFPISVFAMIIGYLVLVYFGGYSVEERKLVFAIKSYR
ncbi:MAG: flippase [Ignavibacteriales bacterium]|nr:flippase [Ignavibacteriales bacterium]